LLRKDGLEVRFSGKENVTSLGVRQLTTAEPGRYRFSAEVKADELTTDEGPFFLRRASLRFDNAIAGTLHIYQVSLAPLRCDHD
jgi:hypothetical protein